MTNARLAYTGHSLNVHIENYLKAIWNLQSLNQDPSFLVQNSQIALSLKVKRPTVTEMLQRLESLGFIKLVPRHGVRLSPLGEKKVRALIRRHRLVELFLQKTLNLKSDVAHEEAELLEHVISQRLSESIDTFLGNPEKDLQGMPMLLGAHQKKLRACDMSFNEWLKVSACPDYNEETHKKLIRKGIRVGLKIKREMSSKAYSYFFKSEKGKSFSLNKQEAQHIYVSPLELSRAKKRAYDK